MVEQDIWHPTHSTMVVKSHHSHLATPDICALEKGIWIWRAR